jgi:DNA-binding protein H-NS
MAKAASYAQLKAQMEALEQQLAEAKAIEQQGAIEEIREKCRIYDLTADDIFPRARGKVGAPKGTKAAPKYRDPETGATWTGRGKPPHWIAGKDRAQFAI